MPLVGFVSQKGGVGKSTLARALAREAAAAGLVVKIADLDLQQATSLSWARRRMAAGIEPVVPAEPFKTAADAVRAAAQVQLMCLDGPARASRGTLDIANAANLVVQPAAPGVDDLEPAVALFRELVGAGVPKAKLVIALTKVATQAEEDMARASVEAEGFAVLPVSLPERAAYRAAMNEGRAITEVTFKGLAERAQTVIQSIVDRAGL